DDAVFKRGRHRACGHSGNTSPAGTRSRHDTGPTSTLEVARRLPGHAEGACDVSTRPRWQFWNRSKPEQPAPETAPPVKTRVPSRWQTPPLADPVKQQKLDQLRRRREMIAYDLERAEAAQFPDNPWQARIDLLDESLATIEADLAALDRLPPDPTFPVPPVPITGIAATGDEPATVRFQIGAEQFLFEEETDWDQRGGPVVRGQLRQRSGDAANLVPADTPANLRS